MFFSLNNDINLTYKYLRSVTYHLHPTFNHLAKQMVLEPPFYLTKVTPEPFTVVCVVAF